MRLLGRDCFGCQFTVPPQCRLRESGERLTHDELKVFETLFLIRLGLEWQVVQQAQGGLALITRLRHHRLQRLLPLLHAQFLDAPR